MLILIVDDANDFAAILETKFQKLGLKTATAINGKDGIEKARALKPNLIVLDVQMPVMDGITTLEHLKKDHDLQNIPVVLLSNYADPRSEQYISEEERARKKGAEDFILKTSDLDEIIARIHSILKRHT